MGREQEIKTVQVLLRHPEVRLLTLTGPGGVGKTRLALQAAADLSRDFVDGVIFISLESIASSDLVIPTIAHVVGSREAGKRPLFEQLVFHLQDKQLLLILDNFEQVITAGTYLTDLLGVCPDVKLLVTSRELLHVRGEHEFAVPLFPRPDVSRLRQVGQGLAKLLADDVAVSLFVQRASAIKHEFQLTDENALSIAQICRRLDGLPLAIELAAARVKLFSPQALLIHLEQATRRNVLSLLSEGPRDAPLRQQALRDTIQWSYDLLSGQEQQLLVRLSVFAGGFSLDAAEAVVVEQGQPHEILNSLSSLVDKSLLQQTGVYSEPRFSMLVMIREFAVEQLETSADEQSVYTAHAAYYLRLAEMAAPYLRSSQQEQWLDQLEQEHDNFRIALRRLLERTDDNETLVRLGNVLYPFWLLRGYLSEGHRWLETIFEKKTTAALPERLRSHLLVGTGILNYYQGNPHRAVTLLQDGFTLFQQLDDRAGIVSALQGLARAAMRGGQLDRAIELYEECREISRTLNDDWGVAHALAYLGLTRWTQGDSDAARPILEEGLARFRQIGDPHGIAQALQAMGFVESSVANLSAAYALFSESLLICRRSGDKAGTARALYALGLIAMLRQEHLQARDLLVEAMALLQALGDRYHFCGCLALVASLVLYTGQTLRAVQLWGALDALMQVIDSAPPVQVRTMMVDGQREAQSRLSETTFATAWAEGQAMTWDQVYEVQSQALAEIGIEIREPSATYPDGLTEREVEVLHLVAQGLTNVQIAEQLVVSHYTINAHLRSIYNKLDVPSRTAATRYAFEHNLASSDSET